MAAAIIKETPAPSGSKHSPQPSQPSQKSMSKAERRELQERQRAAKLVQKQQIGGPSAPSSAKSKAPSAPQRKQQAADAAKSKDSSAAKDLATTSAAMDDVSSGLKSRGLRIFSHFGVPKQLGSGVKGVTDIHPAIIRIGLLFSEFKICGANARCIATLSAFKTVCTPLLHLWLSL